VNSKDLNPQTHPPPKIRAKKVPDQLGGERAKCSGSGNSARILPELAEHRKYPAARKIRRRMVHDRTTWPDVQTVTLDSRLAQLLEIEGDPSSSEDNREAARGDALLEFPTS
jgi:hypothetical protein